MADLEAEAQKVRQPAIQSNRVTQDKSPTRAAMPDFKQ